MPDDPPARYIAHLPPVFRQADAANGQVLDQYLTIFQAVLGPPLDPSAPDPDTTVVRKALTQLLDVLPGLFHPRFSFLFPGDDRPLPLFSSSAPPDYKYDAAPMNTLNDYFGLADPPPDNTWQDAVSAAVADWVADFLNWQAGWMGLDCDGGWTLDKQRDVVARILPIFRQRGTALGLQTLLQIFVDPGFSVHDLIDAPSLTIGRTTLLASDYTAQAALVGGVRPYCFAVVLTVQAGEETSDDTLSKLAAARLLIDREKPVHTSYTLQATHDTQTGGSRVARKFSSAIIR